jgi:ribosomal protein S12 methylthiotransferase
MLGDFLRAGYEIEASDEARASLLVVNTCGFLGAAREEGDGVIRRLAAVKEQRLSDGKACVLVVTGCMVNLDKEAVLLRHPTIDHLVGGGGIGKVLAATQSGQQLVDVPTAASRKSHSASASAPLLSHLEDDVHKGDGAASEVASLAALRASLAAGEAPLVGARLIATPRHLAYLKIAEGCRKRCSFCIIPLIKGALRSKPIDQVAPICTPAPPLEPPVSPRPLRLTVSPPIGGA